MQHGFINPSQALGQLSPLEDYLDPITEACLQAIHAPQRGARCLELGPGRGSITGLLLDRVGPGGSVVAVDRDPSRLMAAPNLQIVQDDLQMGLPAAGPFELIHARLLLAHLPNRRQLVRRMIDTLAPGGWLVIGEWRLDHPLTELSTSGTHAEPLFSRVVEQTKQLMVKQDGVELGWTDQVQTTMAAAGLQRTKTTRHLGIWVGADWGCRLLLALASRKHDQLLAAGLTASDLQDFYDLMGNPDFSCSAWPFVYTWGQQPAYSSTIWVP